MGGRLIGIAADRALAPWDGIFFELSRESDFRAVGQEPGWLLEIRHGRDMLLITDYGADTAVAPVPRAETDSASGARTYHATGGPRSPGADPTDRLHRRHERRIVRDHRHHHPRRP
jgi:hypothetical protein